MRLVVVVALVVGAEALFLKETESNRLHKKSQRIPKKGELQWLEDCFGVDHDTIVRVLTMTDFASLSDEDKELINGIKDLHKEDFECPAGGDSVDGDEERRRGFKQISQTTFRKPDSVEKIEFKPLSEFLDDVSVESQSEEKSESAEESSDEVIPTTETGLKTLTKVKFETPKPFEFKPLKVFSFSKKGNEGSKHMRRVFNGKKVKKAHDNLNDKLILKYTFHESPEDYATAQSICQASGGSLAMPRSPQQWEELLAARPSEDVQLTDSVWLGLDAIDGGTWRWNSGDDVTWADWMDGQPDGSGECGVWYTRDPPASWAQADRWDDWRCAESLSFVCQSDCYDIYGPSHCPWQCPNPNCRRSCGMCGGDTFWTKMWSEINPPWYANYNMNDRNIKRLLDVMTKHKKTE